MSFANFLPVVFAGSLCRRVGPLSWPVGPPPPPPHLVWSTPPAISPVTPGTLCPPFVLLPFA